MKKIILVVGIILLFYVNEGFSVQIFHNEEGLEKGEIIKNPINNSKRSEFQTNSDRGKSITREQLFFRLDGLAQYMGCNCINVLEESTIITSKTLYFGGIKKELPEETNYTFTVEFAVSCTLKRNH